MLGISIRTIAVGDRRIGRSEPTFIIAEAGINHNGDLDKARKLIDVAKRAGVDAVKFQTFKTESLVTTNASMADYQKEATKNEGTQFDMIKEAELGYSDFETLKEYCDELGILFLTTPHSTDVLDFVDNLVPIHKIGSGDLTNIPFLKRVARLKKPILLSTGMANLCDVEAAVEAIEQEGNEDVILLHCVSSYPAELHEMNIRAMNTLQDAFQLLVGLSDHSLGYVADVAAVSLGACVLEKHFTLDKSLPGPDHKASMNPEELENMVQAVRHTEEALGTGEKKPTAAEQEMKLIARKSIVTTRSISEGSVITEGMITIKRPGDGIEPKHLKRVIGSMAKRDIGEDQVLGWDEIA